MSTKVTLSLNELIRDHLDGEQYHVLVQLMKACNTPSVRDDANDWFYGSWKATNLHDRPPIWALIHAANCNPKFRFTDRKASNNSPCLFYNYSPERCTNGSQHPQHHWCLLCHGNHSLIDYDMTQPMEGKCPVWRELKKAFDAVCGKPSLKGCTPKQIAGLLRADDVNDQSKEPANLTFQRPNPQTKVTLLPSSGKAKAANNAAKNNATQPTTPLPAAKGGSPPVPKVAAAAAPQGGAPNAPAPVSVEMTNKEAKGKVSKTKGGPPPVGRVSVSAAPLPLQVRDPKAADSISCEEMNDAAKDNAAKLPLPAAKAKGGSPPVRKVAAVAAPQGGAPKAPAPVSGEMTNKAPKTIQPPTVASKSGGAPGRKAVVAPAPVHVQSPEPPVAISCEVTAAKEHRELSPDQVANYAPKDSALRRVILACNDPEVRRTADVKHKEFAGVKKDHPFLWTVLAVMNVIPEWKVAKCSKPFEPCLHFNGQPGCNKGGSSHTAKFHHCILCWENHPLMGTDLSLHPPKSACPKWKLMVEDFREVCRKLKLTDLRAAFITIFRPDASDLRDKAPLLKAPKNTKPKAAEKKPNVIDENDGNGRCTQAEPGLAGDSCVESAPASDDDRDDGHGHSPEGDDDDSFCSTKEDTEMSSESDIEKQRRLQREELPLETLPMVPPVASQFEPKLSSAARKAEVKELIAQLQVMSLGSTKTQDLPTESQKNTDSAGIESPQVSVQHVSTQCDATAGKDARHRSAADQSKIEELEASVAFHMKLAKELERRIEAVLQERDKLKQVVKDMSKKESDAKKRLTKALEEAAEVEEANAEAWDVHRLELETHRLEIQAAVGEEENAVRAVLDDAYGQCKGVLDQHSRMLKELSDYEREQDSRKLTLARIEREESHARRQLDRTLEQTQRDELRAKRALDEFREQADLDMKFLRERNEKDIAEAARRITELRDESARLEVSLQQLRDTIKAEEPTPKINDLGFTAQDTWTLVLRVLRSRVRKLVPDTQPTVNTPGMPVSVARPVNRHLHPCCASSAAAPLLASFLAGLAECGLEPRDIIGEDGKVNSHKFQLCFHGTYGAEGLCGISHGGLDPQKRGKHGQAHGQGEYFGGSFATAHGYSRGNGGVFAVLIVKQKISNTHKDIIVVDNPPLTSGKTYCLPFAWLPEGVSPLQVKCDDPRCGAAVARDSAAGMYEFEESPGVWLPVDPLILEAIHDHLARGVRRFDVSTNRFTYIIDLDQSTQCNVGTNRERRLRRAP